MKPPIMPSAHVRLPRSAIDVPLADYEAEMLLKVASKK